MKKLSLLILAVSLGLVGCAADPAPSDKSSANKDPAQWQQYKAKKGVEELDSNTK